MSSNVEVHLSREMGLMDVTMIGVGAMIGAGIFVLTGIAAGVAGPALILAFLLNGIVTLFAAGAYAELGSSFHDAGGGYLWVKTGLKDPQGFMSGWMSWFAHAVACSLYALGFGAYFHLVLPLVGVTQPVTPFMPLEKWLAIAAVLLFAYINYRGASETGKAGNVVTVGKIVILAVFIAFGIVITLRRPDWQAVFANFTPNGYGGVFTAMGLTFIAFEGYEIIAQCSEEVREPKKNVPRAVFLSLLIVVPIYLLVAFAALGAIQPEGMASWQFLGLNKETALVEAASHFFSGGGVMLLIGGLLSTLSALNATIYSSSRVSFAMGRDRNLPGWFGRIHEKRKTPHWAILASSAVIIFMAVALPIEEVASAADIMFLLLFVQVLIVLIALRKKRPDLDRGFRVPLVPLVPILGIILQLALAVQLFFYTPRAWVTAGIWIVLGLGVFYVYARKRDRAYARVIAGREAAARHQYRILVCVSNPDRSDALLGSASILARHFDAEVLALTVVEVPEGEILAHGVDQTAEARAMLEASVERLVEAGVRARAVVTVAHRTSYGIVETALHEECNLIILGRARRVSVLERLAATIVDRVVRSAPVQVIEVCADHWPEKIRWVTLAFEGGPHTALTTQLARAFAAHANATLRAVNVIPADSSAEQLSAARHEVAEMMRQHAPGARMAVLQAPEVVAALERAARGSELIVIGGTEAGFLEHLLGYVLPLELADRTTKPVVIVYEMTREPSRWLPEETKAV